MPGDLDVTTDARPERVLELLRGWASSTWNTGIAFGTVGAEVRGVRLEITTFRADRYDRESRNPEVAWGDSLADDLARRDFTVNAMAVRLPELAFVDPFGGLDDLAAGLLRTPIAPDRSFDDDPLRMMRAARFAAQLGMPPAELRRRGGVVRLERAGRLEASAAQCRDRFPIISCTHLEHICPNEADVSPHQANICSESKRTMINLRSLRCAGVAGSFLDYRVATILLSMFS